MVGNRNEIRVSTSPITNAVHGKVPSHFSTAVGEGRPRPVGITTNDNTSQLRGDDVDKGIAVKSATDPATSSTCREDVGSTMVELEPERQSEKPARATVLPKERMLTHPTVVNSDTDGGTGAQTRKRPTEVFTGTQENPLGDISTIENPCKLQKSGNSAKVPLPKKGAMRTSGGTPNVNNDVKDVSGKALSPPPEHGGTYGSSPQRKGSETLPGKSPRSSGTSITVKLGDAEACVVAYKIRMTTRLEKLMKMHCYRMGVPYCAFRFIHDGRRLEEDETPADRGMENNDVIDVMVSQIGG